MQPTLARIHFLEQVLPSALIGCPALTHAHRKCDTAGSGAQQAYANDAAAKTDAAQGTLTRMLGGRMESSKQVSVANVIRLAKNQLNRRLGELVGPDRNLGR